MKLLVQILVMLLFLPHSVAGQTIVFTQHGRVQSMSTNARTEVFRGIPYAAPPVGNLRWRAPQPPQSWNTVRMCNKWGDAPYQLSPNLPGNKFYRLEFRDTTRTIISEDCLYLNVFMPKGVRNKMPVMVWIHGGAFWTGRSYGIEFMGDSLATRGVILVTVGYRLGIAGFFAHPSLAQEAGTTGSGNYAFMDMIAALKWVRDNIEAFGGNKDNVTLFGESAGAGSVQLLLSSPLAKGLFHKAILQSGGGYRNIIFPVGRKWVQNFGKGLMKYAGCNSIDELRQVPMRLLDSLTLRYASRRWKIPFVWPTIDKHVIAESPWHATRRKHEMPMPCIVGYTKNDLMHCIMKRAAHNWAKMRNEQGDSTWVYSFDRSLPGHNGKKPGNSGAPHTAELRYVFGTLALSWRPWRKADWELSKEMITYWTNFAKSGNPNSNGVPLWEPYTKNKRFVRHFDVPKDVR